MKLIDTYVSEVGRSLPRKNRADIEAEIRSVLEDMLEERSQKTGKPVDDEITFDVLKEYGAPEKVAASYMPERYLIGPRLYPIFLTTIRILFPVIAILAGIGAIVNVSQHVPSVVEVSGVFVSALTGIVTSVISALGNLVLIFAIIEWVLRNEGISIKGKAQPKTKEWDPHSLTKLSAPNQIKIGEMVAEIVASFAAIVIFNFYPQIIGFTPSLNGVVESGSWAIGFGNATFTPLLSETFFYCVPYLTLLWALTILLNIALLRMGYWNTVTRIFAIGLKIINIIIAAVMLAGPSLLTITTATLTTALGDAEAARILMMLVSQLVRVILWLVILLEGIDIVKIAYRMTTNRPLPAVAPEKQ